jgi:hypothetical protein
VDPAERQFLGQPSQHSSIIADQAANNRPFALRPIREEQRRVFHLFAHRVPEPLLGE